MSSKRQFGFWRTLYLALYSKELYRDVARNWAGSAAFYLLLLITLSCAFNTMTTSYGWNNSYQAFAMQSTSSSVINADSAQKIDINSKITQTTGKHGALGNIFIFGLNIIASVVSYVAILLIGLIVSALAKIFVNSLSFKSLYRLAIVALTPSFVIGLISVVLIPASTLSTLSIAYLAVFVLLPLFYFIYGIRANTANPNPFK